MPRLIVFDIDGVLNDGTYLITDNGEEIKKINFKDLDSFNLIKKNLNLKTLFLSSENTKLANLFVSKFEPHDYLLGVQDKYLVLKEFITNHQYSWDDVWYIGDGKKDYEVMQKVGFSLAPANAILEIKDIASYQLLSNGGDGVVYEVYELLKKEICSKKLATNLNLEKTWQTNLEDHLQIINLIKNDQEFFKNLELAINMIIESIQKGGCLYACGNGGSACDSLHLVTELISKFNYERKSLPAISLNSNQAILTAIGNDYDFSKVFKRQVEGLLTSKDVLFCISTSGNSLNIKEAIQEALNKNIKVILLTGSKAHYENKANLAVIKVPNENTPRIQEVHIIIIHYICEIIEKYFKDGDLNAK